MSYVVIRDPRTTSTQALDVHSSRSAAEGDAQGRAMGAPGVAFFVCAFVSSVVVPDLKPPVVRFDDGSGHSDPWEPPF